MTDKERSDAERLISEYMDINEFESGLKHKAIYTHEIILGWIRSTFRFAYADACEAKRTEIEFERARSAKLIEALHDCQDAASDGGIDQNDRVIKTAENAIAEYEASK